jgi:hypothetical protein
LLGERGIFLFKPPFDAEGHFPAVYAIIASERVFTMRLRSSAEDHSVLLVI